MKKLNQLLLPVLFISLFTSCKKQSQEDEDQITCNNIRNIKITATTPVKIGEKIQINVPEVGGNRIYSWHGPNNFDSQYPENSIDYAELKHEGWYYVAVSNNSCETKIDSVYIDVNLEQGTAPCNTSTNAVTYNNLADDNFTYLYKGIESTYGLFSLEGSGSGNLYVYFHPEWRIKEPEDGIYTTTNIPSFDQVDANYNKLFISTRKESIYWSCYEGQQVYVSHVNGKLKIKFCGLEMSGYNGMSFKTIASGDITEK